MQASVYEWAVGRLHSRGPARKQNIIMSHSWEKVSKHCLNVLDKMVRCAESAHKGEGWGSDCYPEVIPFWKSLWWWNILLQLHYHPLSGFDHTNTYRQNTPCSQRNQTVFSFIFSLSFAVLSFGLRRDVQLECIDFIYRSEIGLRKQQHSLVNVSFRCLSVRSISQNRFSFFMHQKIVLFIHYNLSNSSVEVSKSKCQMPDSDFLFLTSQKKTEASWGRKCFFFFFNCTFD